MNKKLIFATIISFGAFGMFASADDMSGTPVTEVPAHSEMTIEDSKSEVKSEVKSDEVKAPEKVVSHKKQYKKTKQAKKEEKKEETK